MGRLPGKKAGDLWCDLGERGHGGQRVRFDLRVEATSGTWYVVHNGKTYDAKTVEELRTKMAEVAKAENSMTWSRFIVLDYESERATHRHQYGSNTADRNDKPPKLVKGISLTWEVKEFSSVITPIGTTELAIMERSVHEDGTTGEPSEYRRSYGRGRNRVEAPEMPDGCIPYTPEREAFLVRMRQALTVVDRKIRQVLGGDLAEVAARLDAGFAAEVLALPAAELDDPPLDVHAVAHRRHCALNDETTDDEDDEATRDWNPKTMTDAEIRKVCDCGAIEEAENE